MPVRISRLRHIHIPDSAPHYPPFNLAKRVERLARQQVRDWKAHSEDFGADETTYFRPPPTVLSFTSAPTYFLENGSPGTRRLTAAAVKPIRLKWPRSGAFEAPNPNFDVLNHRNKTADVAVSGDPFDHSYKPGILEPLQWHMPPYHGPGRLVLWPVLDLGYFRAKDNTAMKNKLASLFAYTTKAMLQREFGIVTSVGDDCRSLKVSSGAQIATIWPEVRNGVSTHGVTINMAEPEEVVSGQRAPEGDNSPQEFYHEAVTSVAAELASVRKLTKVKKPEQRRFVTLIPLSRSASSAGKGTQWYTRTYEDVASFAPLGMDNYGFGMSWAYELARMVDITLIESKGVEGWDLHDFSQSKKQPRLPPRTPVRTVTARPQETQPPSVGLRLSNKQESVPNWELTQWTLLRDLEKYVTNHELNMGKLKKLLGQKPQPSRLDKAKESPVDANLSTDEVMEIFRDNTPGDTVPLSNKFKRQRKRVTYFYVDSRSKTTTKEMEELLVAINKMVKERRARRIRINLPKGTPLWKWKMHMGIQRRDAARKRRMHIKKKVWTDSKTRPPRTVQEMLKKGTMPQKQISGLKMSRPWRPNLVKKYGQRADAE